MSGGVHHFAIQVRDLVAAERFYCGVLGLAVVRRWPAPGGGERSLWVDTTVGARKVLKGGSWLEANPANQRAATRRYELPSRADTVSGFRCARSLANWPDTDVWLSSLM